MSKRSRIYLDTSVINFLFADDAPEKRATTIEFFDNFIKTGVYDATISEVVIAEMEATPDEEQRNRLLAAVDTYSLEMLQPSEVQFGEIEDLALKYLTARIIPEQKLADAFHVSYCVIFDTDYLVSWNYRHLANINKERLIRIVNLENNYNSDLRIITPLELMGYES